MMEVLGLHWYSIVNLSIERAQMYIDALLVGNMRFKSSGAKAAMDAVGNDRVRAAASR